MTREDELVKAVMEAADALVRSMETAPCAWCCSAGPELLAAKQALCDYRIEVCE